MTWHVLKAQAPAWADVNSGVKSFELRFDDRDYEVGDILELQEYDEAVGMFTGRVCYRQVSYIMRPRDVSFAIPLTSNGCAMSIAPLTKEEALLVYRSAKS